MSHPSWAEVCTKTNLEASWFRPTLPSTVFGKSNHQKTTSGKGSIRQSARNEQRTSIRHKLKTNNRTCVADSPRGSD
eukprot:842176-Amphidinium_carterae.1